ncbi:MAG TPA: MFS transporter [Kofleriaceae bacterium]|nr:MFS transporter [Kofleriaceae bacterium]
MTASSTSGLRDTFRALRHPQFRAFWLTSFVSNTGLYAQDIAQGWLVLEMTGSAEWLGVAAAARTLPALVLSPLGGVYADRWNRRLALGVYQACLTLCTAVLALLVSLGAVRPWHFVAAAIVTGAGNALSQPTNSSLVKDLLPAEDLVSGVTLYVQQVQIARTVGPLIASGIFWFSSVEYGFHFNALSYVPLVVFCFAGRTPRASAARPAARQSVFGSMVDGAIYAGSTPRLLVLLQVSAIATLGLFILPTLLPVANRELGGSAHQLAYLNGVAGLSAVIGATLVPLLLERFHWAAVLRVSLIGSGLALLALTVPRGTAVVFALTALQGGAGIAVWVVITAMLQRAVSDEYRGRVLSLNTLALGVGTMLGNLGSGVLTERSGLSVAFLALAAVMIVALVPLLARLHDRE